jgi:hypothetical protein
MRFVILLLVMAAVLTTMVFSAMAQSLPSGSFMVAEAGSCRGWLGTCNSRCGHGAKCGPGFCSSKFEECRQTGCWTEGSNYGSAEHCGLKK